MMILSLPLLWWLWGIIALVLSSLLYNHEPAGSGRRLLPGFLIVVYGSFMVMALVLSL